MLIGKYNELTVVKKVDFGLYLADNKGDDSQVLLPKNQVPDGCKQGDTLNVFIYKDSRDRLIATLKTPKMTLGEIGRCRVIEVGGIGAFLDWGLEKDLLLPFREMTGKLSAGMEIPVALYVDKSGRLCATMKLYRYLGTAEHIKKGDTVSGTVYELSDNFGAFIAIEDNYQGLIPKRELTAPVRVGDTIRARVASVKADGKIDLSLRELSHIQMDIDADRLLKLMEEHGGSLPFNDHASPELIKNQTSMSKNEFKRAVGRLLKLGKIELKADSIILR